MRFCCLNAFFSGKDTGISLENFVQERAVPACFMAPMAPSFDLCDAQTVLALNESTYLMKAIQKIQVCQSESCLCLCKGEKSPVIHSG